jgi:hypothetical protein
MRFEQLSTLALAVTAAATPLADKIYQLNDIINGLEQSLANWQGSYVGMITILMPSLTANVQALLLTSDITNTAKAAGALSEEDADNVLAALEESNNGRPTVEQTVIQKVVPFRRQGRVFGFAAVIGAVNSLLFAVAVTVGAFVYNVSADLVGGIEVTLSERD